MALIFNRNRGRSETEGEWIYWVNPEGASLENQQLLIKIAKLLTYSHIA
jgi:hypothetical protein